MSVRLVHASLDCAHRVSRRRKLVSAVVAARDTVDDPRQKCDGVRPVCQPCANMKREYECKYDDNTKKSRTQLLREKLMTLQETVRALEYNNTFNHDGPSRRTSSCFASVA